MFKRDENFQLTIGGVIDGDNLIPFLKAGTCLICLLLGNKWASPKMCLFSLTKAAFLKKTHIRQ